MPKKPIPYCETCTTYIDTGTKKVPVIAKLYRNGTNELGNQRYRCSQCGKNTTVPTKLSKLEKKRLRYFRKYNIVAWCEWPKKRGESVVDWTIPDGYVVVLTKKQLRSIFEKRYVKLVKKDQMLQPALIPLNIPKYEYEYLEDDYLEDDLIFLDLDDD